MDEQEAELTDMLLIQLIREKERTQVYSNIIVQNIVFLLLNIIARAIQENTAANLSTKGNKNIIHGITSYIQQNIYQKDQLKIESLARQFNKTSDHLNKCFKQQTGLTLKTYISQYKLRLVESRLRYSDLNISEIANELGFTDESHLNKMFKNAYGKTAKEYRKSVAGH